MHYDAFDDTPPDDPFDPMSMRAPKPPSIESRGETPFIGDLPPEGDRWSNWEFASKGPKPWPQYVITEAAAVDHELGILKTGKEADVFLLERMIPGTERSTLLAAKRYRDLDHRAFRRDAAYMEGRNVRKSRERRALANRTRFGRTVLASEWAIAEFGVLATMWEAGAPVPYPVQLMRSELLMEFVGDPDGAAAPRLAETRPSRDELGSLWEQCLEAMSLLARAGLAHGDLSPYNLLVHHGRLVMIDVPQAVDVVSNPQGMDFLYRDARNICDWFGSKGLEYADPDVLMGQLIADVGL